MNFGSIRKPHGKTDVIPRVKKTIFLPCDVLAVPDGNPLATLFVERFCLSRWEPSYL